MKTFDITHMVQLDAAVSLTHTFTEEEKEKYAYFTINTYDRGTVTDGVNYLDVSLNGLDAAVPLMDNLLSVTLSNEMSENPYTPKIVFMYKD